MVKIFLLAFCLQISIAHPAMAAEQDLGPMYVSSRTFSLDMHACEKSWIIESKFSASCHVDNFPSTQAFLLTVNSFLRNWKYESGEGWQIQVTIQLTATGYVIQLLGTGRVPENRLKFAIAQKYIKSAIDSAKKYEPNNSMIETPLFQSVVMKSENSAGVGEKISGQVHYVKRSLLLNSVELKKICIDQMAKNANKHCMVHLGRYSRGEVILSTAEFVTRVATNNNSSQLKLTMAAVPGWGISGPFSIGYFRMDFKGTYSAAIFNTLYAAALRKYAAPTFDIYAHVAAGAEKSALYVENDLGPIHLVRREVNINYELCEKSWRQSGDSGYCEVTQKWSSPRIGDSSQLVSKMVTIGAASYYIVIEMQREGYKVQVFGSGKYATVRPFIERAVVSLPDHQLSDYALALPK